MEREYKTFPGMITGVDEALGIVEPIWAVMGNIDDGQDIVHPGAFTKTFVEHGHRVKVLDHHNSRSVMDAIGVPVELRELSRKELPAELLERYPHATGGAYGKVQMLMDTPEGRGAFIRLQTGAIDEWSFGFDVLDSDLTKERRDNKEIVVRNLRTLKLWEISPVIFGMNSATTTLSAKEADDKSINLTERVNAVRASFSDRFNPGDEYNYCVSTVYDDRVIVESEAMAEFYSVAYTADAEGNLVFASEQEWTPGEFVFIPKIKADDELRERKQELVASLRTALAEAEALLDATLLDASPAPAEDAGRDDDADDQGAGPAIPPTSEDTERLRADLLASLATLED